MKNVEHTRLMIVPLALDIAASHIENKKRYTLTSSALPFLCLIYDDVERLQMTLLPVVQTMLWANQRLATTPHTWAFEKLLIQGKVDITFTIETTPAVAPVIPDGFGRWCKSPRGVHFFVPFLDEKQHIASEFMEHIKRLTPGAH